MAINDSHFDDDQTPDRAKLFSIIVLKNEIREMSNSWNLSATAFVYMLLLHTLTWAGTYYIDPSAQYNGDGSLGISAARPGYPGAFNTWPQYPHAAGDKYYQKCGTTFIVPWQYGIYFGDKNGSARNETIFGAYYLDGNNNTVVGVSGDKPIITGLTALPGWDKTSNWSYRGNNIWGWELGSTSPYRLWINGTERLMVGLNPRVEDAATDGVGRIDPHASPAIYWCHDTYPPDGGGDVGNTLYVYSMGNPATTYSSMKGLQSIDRCLLIRNSDYVIIENLDIRAAKICLFVDRSDYLKIENCEIGKGGNVGILIRGTIIGDSGLTADQGVIKGCTIDSDFHFAGYKYEDQAPNNGIEMKDGVNGWEIYQNDIKNWGHSCVNIFSLDSSSPVMTSNNNKVYENYFTAPEASHCRAFNLSGSTTGRCSNNKIYRNYIYNMPTRSQIIADDNKIYYNIFDTMTNNFYYLHDELWKTSGDGIEIWASDENKSCEYNRIYNNVFYNTGEAGIRLISWGHDQRVHNNEIINNIFYNCGVNAKSGRESFDSGDYAGAALVVESWRGVDDAMLDHNIFRNNIIHNTNNGFDVRYKGRNMSVSTLNQSSRDGDIIENNIQSSPQFIDATNGNFQVKSNSGAIGKGYNLGEDYAKAIASGMTRLNWPGSIKTAQQIVPWDIGAFKYVSSFNLVPLK